MKLVRYALLGVCVLVPLSTFAQDPIVYPAQNQSAEQVEQDTFACYSWAKEQTGVDPMATPKTQSAPPVASSAPSRGRGVAGGAVVGGIIGSTQGEFGKGAAIGAGAGLVGGGIRKRQVERQNQQNQQTWQQQEAAVQQQNRSEYNRAFTACMSGKGYSVK